MGLREENKRKKRTSILRVAKTMFERKGFAGTTMEMIAQRARVAPGTLYNYFSSKRMLLLALFGEAVEETLEAGGRVKADATDGPTAVFELLRLYVQFVDGFDRPFLREVFAEALREPAEQVVEFVRMDMVLVEQLKGLLAELQDAGELATGIDLDQASMLLYGTVMTQVLLFISVEEMPLEALQHQLKAQIDIVFSGLGPNESRRRKKR
jgi:AcrR family transcriptional regulator